LAFECRIFHTTPNTTVYVTSNTTAHIKCGKQPPKRVLKQALEAVLRFCLKGDMVVGEGGGHVNLVGRL